MVTFKELRESRGLTAQDMANICHCHVKTYRRWEKEPWRVGLCAFFRIGEYFNVELEDIDFGQTQPRQ